MKGNILVLTNNISGLAVFRKEVVKSLVDAKFNVYVAGPDDNGLVESVQNIGCQIIKTTFDRRGMNPLADLKLMLMYTKLIRKLKPKVVLTYTIKPNVYGGIVCRLCHVPQIANVTGLGDALENGGWLKRLIVALYKIGIGKAKCIFFQNGTNKEIFTRFGIANRFSILLPGSGVNLQHHIFQPYPLDKGSVRFLFIGRMLKDKGVEEYFEAARCIKTKYPNTEFQTLIWENDLGKYKDTLHSLITAGIINHLGGTYDVRPFIAAVECTVMPSYHEGMSNVNLESASCGRPVITTDVPGCKETVDEGITGFLVPPRDADALTNAIERFLKMSYSEKVLMGKAARRKMEREFDRKIVVDTYLREIKNLDS